MHKLYSGRYFCICQYEPQSGKEYWYLILFSLYSLTYSPTSVNKNEIHTIFKLHSIHTMYATSRGSSPHEITCTSLDYTIKICILNKKYARIAKISAYTFYINEPVSGSFRSLLHMQVRTGSRDDISSLTKLP